MVHTSHCMVEPDVGLASPTKTSENYNYPDKLITRERWLKPWSSLTLFGSLDHEFGDLLRHLAFTALGALYLTLLVFTYGHEHRKRLFAGPTQILISRHGHTSSRPAHWGQSLLCHKLKLFRKDYSEI